MRPMMTSEMYYYLRGLIYDKPKKPRNPEKLLEQVSHEYLNDRASYVVHERFTVEESGYTFIEGKPGYDGYCETTGIKAEVKTCNITFDENNVDVYKCGPYKGELKPPRKFRGTGIFSNYTHALLNKHQDEDVQMLVSGFLNGQAVYILQFPFHYVPFVSHLQNTLHQKLPSGDIQGRNYDIAFSYKQYENCEDLVCNYRNTGLIGKFPQFFTVKFYNLLNRIPDSK